MKESTLLLMEVIGKKFMENEDNHNMGYLNCYIEKMTDWIDLFNSTPESQSSRCEAPH